MFVFYVEGKKKKKLKKGGETTKIVWDACSKDVQNRTIFAGNIVCFFLQLKPFVFS